MKKLKNEIFDLLKNNKELKKEVMIFCEIDRLTMNNWVYQKSKYIGHYLVVKFIMEKTGLNENDIFEL